MSHPSRFGECSRMMRNTTRMRGVPPLVFVHRSLLFVVALNAHDANCPL